MKRIILSLTFLIVAVSAMTAQKELISGPAISVNEEVHDYGTIPYDSPGTYEFIVTNTGTEPLIISNCSGSCGCTVPTCDTNPIMPGEQSKIKVKYDTKRVGPFTKTVTVNSNATNEPSKILTIKGTVAPENK
ncbi:MAG TPA: DUF1573 domain-containing protein [Flavobacteriales bacterium]